MPCKQWNDDWIARLYGELDPAEERALDEHLERCAACRETLDGLGASRELLREAAPEVPATPRVVVLRPRPVWSTAWAFAAGAVCALLLFGLGFLAGPRWMSTGAASGRQPAQVALTPQAERTEQPAVADVTPTRSEPDPELREDLFALRERLEQLEAQPPDAALTPDQFSAALDRLERRFQQERVRDLEYVIRSITASELRTGTWMDQTNEALTLLALRQDPRFSEQ
jgi:hypothetical protein